MRVSPGGSPPYRQIMRTACAIVTLLAALVAGADRAAGSAGPGDPADMAADAVAVFCGTVVSRELVGDSVNGHTAFFACRVREVWKGDVPDTVLVVSSDFGPGLVVGREYVVCAGEPPINPLAMGSAHGFGPGNRWRGCRLWANIVNTGSFDELGRAALLTLGPPLRVGNGQAARQVGLQDLIDELAGIRPGDPVDAARTLVRSTAHLVALAHAENDADRRLFDAAVAALVAAAAADDSELQPLRGAALWALLDLGRLAAVAVPTLVAMVGTGEPRQDLRYVVVSAGGDDPRVIGRLVELANDPSAGAWQDWARGIFWDGDLDWTDGVPEPADFVDNPDPGIRTQAYIAMARQAVGPDALDAVASAVTRDPDPEVQARALSCIISWCSDERVLDWMRYALTHPDPRVRERGLGSTSLQGRSPATVCEILAFMRTVPYADVQERYPGKVAYFGGPCD